MNTTTVSHFVDVLGSKMHYIEQGEGNPIVLLHGIPTSSYLWRNIIPHLSTLGRCIAPDLIGMGQSDKPDIEYSIFDHIRYIEQFIQALKLKNITFVLHDWGSLIGFDYAMRNENNCKGLVFYEAYLKSLQEELSLPFQELIFKLEEKISQDNIVNNGDHFVDQMIGQSALYPVNEKAMAVYRQPFLKKGSGKPLLQYLHEQSNPKVNQLIAGYTDKLIHSALPKLLLYSMPGFITPIETVVWAKMNLTNLEIIDIGEALHYAQETNPISMGESISVWMQGVEIK